MIDSCKDPEAPSLKCRPQPFKRIGERIVAFESHGRSRKFAVGNAQFSNGEQLVCETACSEQVQTIFLFASFYGSERMALSQ